ncbi:MAG: cyclic nucleotide-binding domain-containing protein [Halothiobacillaceae bacterium]|nr:cyclic nucleotide-binding domain-containing protein [Halothiobacillaceae bacterium]
MITEQDREHLIGFLGGRVDCRVLTRREINDFLDYCELLSVPTGQIIADIGEVGESLYFLLEGEASLIVGPRENEVEVGRILTGEMLGEMSFFDRQPRLVRLRSIGKQPARLLRLPRLMYERLRLERPFLAVLLLEYALISLDHLYRRTSTDVAVLNQYIHNIGK